MIIQKVVKGIPELERYEAEQILACGIISRWWESENPLPYDQVPLRLTPRNLDWHQNQYSTPDPTRNNQVFGDATPFISTTAGTIERDAVLQRNVMHPAWLEALYFATRGWSTDGWLFYCYLFVLGKPSIEHEGFSEELRELNIYTAFSPFQVEGEVAAKIKIPPSQISHAELWLLADIQAAARAGTA